MKPMLLFLLSLITPYSLFCTSNELNVRLDTDSSEFQVLYAQEIEKLELEKAKSRQLLMELRSLNVDESKPYGADFKEMLAQAMQPLSELAEEDTVKLASAYITASGSFNQNPPWYWANAQGSKGLLSGYGSTDAAARSNALLVADGLASPAQKGVTTAPVVTTYTGTYSNYYNGQYLTKTATSTVSQAAANSAALQAWNSAYPTYTGTYSNYYNGQYLTKTATSTVSQAVADSAALQAWNSAYQTYTGTYSNYYNGQYLTKTATSTVSQSAADSAALQAWNSAYQTYTSTFNGITKTSTTSQVDADSQAQNAWTAVETTTITPAVNAYSAAQSIYQTELNKAKTMVNELVDLFKADPVSSFSVASWVKL